jgi:hypothetical protein
VFVYLLAFLSGQETTPAAFLVVFSISTPNQHIPSSAPFVYPD